MATRTIGKRHKVVTDASGKTRLVENRKAILKNMDVSTRLKAIARETTKVRYGKKGLS